MLWRNFREVGRVTDENIICRTTLARWIAKLTDSNSEYVILTNFQLQKLLHESPSDLRDSFIAWLVFDAVCIIALLIRRKLKVSLALKTDTCTVQDTTPVVRFN